MTTENLFHRITYVYLFMLLLSVPLAGAQPGKQPPANPYGVNPTVALIIVVIISALFFFAFFLLYFWQCYDDNTRSVHRTVVGGGWLRMETNGLDPAVIETFPTFLYSAVKDLKLGKGALECAVCLKEFEDDEILQLLPKCDHVFHLECINPWLVSHITCPVCRANLMPDEVSITVTDSERGGDEESRRFEIVEDQNKKLPGPDVLNPSQIPVQNRPTRSGSTRPRLAGKFPRSHSTGHSLVQPGENCERFTLRLPEDVRKQIVSGKLNRTRSCVAFSGEGSGSTRRGYRIGGEGSSRGKSYQFVRLDRESKSERWMFSMAPNFFTRTFSGRSPRMAAKGESTTTPGHSFK